MSDEFRDPGRAIDEAVAATCGYPVHDIRAVDYGFDGVPETMVAGPTMLHFTNEGADLHEGYLFRRADGVDGDPVELLNADPSNGSGDLEEIAVTHIGRAGEEIPPPLRRSLAWDQGREMTRHADTAVVCGVNASFAEPHSPWQRPTN